MQFSTLLTAVASLAATAASTATANRARQEGQLAGIATFYGDEACETEVADTTEVTFDVCYNLKEHYQATFFSATLGGEQEFEMVLFEDENCEGAVTVIDSHSCEASTAGLSFSARIKE